MKTPNKKLDKTSKRIRLIARILSIPIIAYALMMVIGTIVNLITTGKADPNAVDNYPFIENLPPIFLLIAIIGLGIAWKYEKIGGFINVLFCLAVLPVLLIHWPITEDSRFIMPYILMMIIALPGVLFLVFWGRTKNE